MFGDVLMCIYLKLNAVKISRIVWVYKKIMLKLIQLYN